jgi:hypothetical protein
VHSLRFLWFGRVSFVLAILCYGCFWGLLLGQAHQHFIRLALLYCFNPLVLLLRFWVLINQLGVNVKYSAKNLTS